MVKQEGHYTLRITLFDIEDLQSDKHHFGPHWVGHQRTDSAVQKLQTNLRYQTVTSIFDDTIQSTLTSKFVGLAGKNSSDSSLNTNQK